MAHSTLYSIVNNLWQFAGSKNTRLILYVSERKMSKLEYILASFLFTWKSPIIMTYLSVSDKSYIYSIFAGEVYLLVPNEVFVDWASWDSTAIGADLSIILNNSVDNALQTCEILLGKNPETKAYDFIMLQT